MQWKTWANLVTGLGFIGIGVYVWAYLNWKVDLILPVLILTVLTDGLDGYLARKLDQRTRLGWILDPIRDKLILLAAAGNIFYIYGSGIVRSLEVVAVFETATFAVNFRRGLPQPIHALGKLRGFAHYCLMSLMMSLIYYDSPLHVVDAERLVLVMAGFSFLAFVGYLFSPAKKIPHKP